MRFILFQSYQSMFLLFGVFNAYFYYNQISRKMKHKLRANNQPIFYYLLLFATLIATAASNLVISVAVTSSFVGKNTNITVNIKTSTVISVLDIYLSNAFTLNAAPFCSINSTSSTCNRIVPETGNDLVVRFSSQNFIANSQYTLLFTAVNPLYSDNFLVRAANSGGPTPIFFSTNGEISITHNQISCSMSSSSPVVGKSSTITFILGLQSLPIGSQGIISLSAPTQSVFPNIFNTGPSCVIENDAYACALSQIFGDQVLTINSSPVGKKNLSIKITSLRNPPFNSTFENITVQIQDQFSRGVQRCVVLQSKPTQLQQSTFFVMDGWLSSVGTTSTNVQILLTPYFTPLSSLTVLLVFPQQLKITPKTPVTIEQYIAPSGTVGKTYLLLGNITYQQKFLKINASISNPISEIPLYLDSYILFNDTHFREKKQLEAGTLVLEPEVMTVSALVTNPQTLVQTKLNISMISPISISKTLLIRMEVEEGEFLCSNLGVLGNIGSPLMQNCTASIVYFQVTSAIMTTMNSYWLQLGYITQVSVKSNNILIKIMDEQSYDIMNGNANIQVGVSAPVFTIVSSNSTFAASTNFNIIQTNSTTLSLSIKRIVTFTPPKYVYLTSTTSLISTDSSICKIDSFQADFGNNKIVATISGKISVSIKNMKNPTYYQFYRVWSIVATDINSNPSSVSSSTQNPQYSPAISLISVDKNSNSTIQQFNNITLKIQPLLQYNLTNNAPTITVQFIGATIINIDQNVCQSCSLLTSTKLQFLAYSVVMYPTILVQNNEDPESNSVNFRITLNNFLFQTGNTNYQLQPIVYSYIADFTGLYEEVGVITINLTSDLDKTVQVTYTGYQTVFPVDSSCDNCNSTYLAITGITGFFKTATITVQGRYNGILYARAMVSISYSCSEIPGCQICEQEGNSSLSCSKCFSESLSKNFLLFSNQCYSSCPVRTYQNGVICSSCPSLCYKCSTTLQTDSGILCQECETPYSLYQQTCVAQCPPGYIKNATHCLARPIQCPQNCIDCPQDNICNKCDAGYYLLENLCYSECPDGYIISEQKQGQCQLFIPPEETDYFPFAFLITSLIALLIFVIIRCFQKRSLIVGNFVAVTSILQIGPIIMMLTYTFNSINAEPDRWADDSILTTQALLFVAVVTKVILNLAFLAYFLVRISPQENFQEYIKEKYKRILYIVLMVLSSVFSFQIIRIIYSRLLGLEIFFGRFNTALIFKPLNYFSLAYLIPSGCLVAMAVNNIIMQNGYKTTIYYSSIEVIVIQALLLIGCMLQACKSDPEYFDYQVYRVGNEYQQDYTPNKIDITYQEQNGGSMAKLNDDPNEVEGYNYHKMGEQRFFSTNWRQKTLRPAISQGDEPEQFEYQDQDLENQKQDSEQGREEDKQKNIFDSRRTNRNKKPLTNRSIFRKKIIQEWQAINNNMQNKPYSIFNRQKPQANIKKHKKSKSKLLNSAKKQKQLQLDRKPTRTSSLTKIQVRSPIFSNIANRSQLKKHFYKIIQRQGESSDKGSVKIAKQSQGTINNQFFEEVSEANTIAENQNDFDRASKGDNQEMVANEYENKIGNNEISQIKAENSEESIQKSLLGLKTNFKLNRYAQYDEFEVDQDGSEEEEKYYMEKNNRNDEQLNQRVSEFLPKRKKIKNKHVNKQTEAVYLQRLMSSQAPRRKSKAKNLDDF